MAAGGSWPGHGLWMFVGFLWVFYLSITVLTFLFSMVFKGLLECVCFLFVFHICLLSPFLLRANVGKQPQFLSESDLRTRQNIAPFAKASDCVHMW